jgi:hypothetical protein
MTGHTPGPWEVHPEGIWFDIFSKDGAVVSCEGIDNEANARLIAAAPDLYAAIINSDDGHWTPAMRAAIAKAKPAKD